MRNVILKKLALGALFGFLMAWMSVGNVVAQGETKPEESVWKIDTAWINNATGTPKDPYKITSAEELAGLAWLVNGEKGQASQSTSVNNFKGKTIILENDIDLKGKPWTPIGRVEGGQYYPFLGNFDGKGHVIRGLYINRSENYQGLFGVVGSDDQYNEDNPEKPTITFQNLGVEGTIVNCGSNSGGIIGTLKNTSVKNCYSNVNITTGDDKTEIGGLIGEIQQTLKDLAVSVEYCYNLGNITVTNVASNAPFGGLVGSSEDVPITNCYNAGNIEVNSNVGSRAVVGGIVGLMKVQLSNCFNVGTISGYAKIGELVGELQPQTMESNFFLNTSSNNAVGDPESSDFNQPNPPISAAEIVNRINTLFTEDKGWEPATTADNGSTRTLTMPKMKLMSSAEAPSVENIPLYGVTLSVNPVEGGSITLPAANQKFEKSETVNLKATIHPNYKWKEWSVKQNADGSGEDIAFTASQNPLEASFVMPANQVKVTASCIGIFAGGQGSVADPYIVSNLDQLKMFRDKVNEGVNYKGLFIKLSSEIDLKDEAWTPIGIDSNHPFEGQFDGAGHVVSGLAINAATNTPQGFFGTIKDGTVSHLGVSGKITAHTSAGGIAGSLEGNSKIENCYSNVQLTGSNPSVSEGLGGVAGKISGNSSIEKCYNAGAVNGAESNRQVGGIVGQSEGTIGNCFNIGSITGGANCGGISGSAATVTNSHYLNGKASKGIGNTADNAEVSGLSAKDMAPSMNEIFKGNYWTTLAGTTDNQDKRTLTMPKLGSVVAPAVSVNIFRTIIETNDAEKIVTPVNNTYFETLEKVVLTTKDGFEATKWTLTPTVSYIGATETEPAYFIMPENDVTVSGNFLQVLKKDPNDTSGNTYLINNKEDFELFRDMVNGDVAVNRKSFTFSGKTVKLMANLDLGSQQQDWSPIGLEEKPFSGMFEGNHHVIKLNICNNNSLAHFGLFGVCEGLGAGIRNLGVMGSISASQAEYTGGIIGFNKNGASTDSYQGHIEGGSTISNCYFIGTIQVSSNKYAGGIVGYTTGDVQNCFHEGSITSSDGKPGWYGGIIGLTNAGKISNCYHVGMFPADSPHGGASNISSASDNGTNPSFSGCAFLRGCGDPVENMASPITPESLRDAMNTNISGANKPARLGDDHKLWLPSFSEEQQYIQLYQLDMKVKVDDVLLDANDESLNGFINAFPSGLYVQGSKFVLPTNNFDEKVYEFANWNPNISTVPANDQTIIANFKRVTYLLKREIYLDNQLIENGKDFESLKDKVIVPTDPVANGTTVNLKAEGFDENAYAFSAWETNMNTLNVNNASKVNASFTMPTQEVIVRAYFWSKHDVKLQFKLGANETVITNGEVYETLKKLISSTSHPDLVLSGIRIGHTVNLSAKTDDAVYEFVSWAVDGATAEVSKENVAIKMQSTDVTATAQFKRKEYTLGTLIILDGKTIDPSSEVYKELNATVTATPSGSVANGENVTLKVSNFDTELYQWVNWTAEPDLTITDATLSDASFKMPTNQVMVAANFKSKDRAGSYELAENLIYNGKEQKGVTKVLVNGKDVVENKDYTIKYENNINAGTAKAMLKFTNPFVKPNELTIDFSIAPAPITVTPKSGQVMYEGDKGFHFVYTTSGEQNGEKVVFDGALLANKDNTIGLGTLALKAANTYKASNYVLKFTEGVAYTAENKQIDKVLEEKSEEVKVTDAPTKNEAGWSSQQEKGFTVDVPTGFEVRVEGETEWHQAAFEYKKETNGLELNIRQTGGTVESKKTLEEVKLDFTTPTVDVKFYSTRIVFIVTDNGSGLNLATQQYTNEKRPDANQKRAARMLRASSVTNTQEFEWRGGDGSNDVTFSISDNAGNKLTKNIVNQPLAYKTFKVTLPSCSYAVLNPGAGAHVVEEGSTFDFILTPNTGYTQTNFTVTVGGKTLTASGNKYTIERVTEDLSVVINFIDNVVPDPVPDPSEPSDPDPVPPVEPDVPTAIENVVPSEFNVRAQNGAIVIAAPKATAVYILDFGGRVLRNFNAPAGTTYYTGFPKGMYIVHTELGTVKIAL